MTPSALLDFVTYLEPLFCLMLLVCLFRSGSVGKFDFLTGLVSTKFLSTCVCVPLLLCAGHVLTKRSAYGMYFYVYWISFAIESILSLLVIYSIFKLAMAPLKGLQTLGTLVFRWAACISVTISIAMSMGPHAASGTRFLAAVVGQMRQTSSILTLCLLLFVCFAIRPMGLSYRSRMFGVSFGLGLLAVVSLVDTAWLSRNSSLASTSNIVNGVAGLVALMIWSVYFAFPEPKRRIIVLPTTSPFLRWNQISQALGDEPGFVAVGGIPPEIFAPAELEVMRRASVKMAASASTETGIAPARSEPSLDDSLVPLDGSAASLHQQKQRPSRKGRPFRRYGVR